MQHAQAYTIQCRGKKLDRKDTFGLSDPFLCVICNGVTIHKTEAISNSLNPNWSPFKLEARDYGSVEAMLKFEVWDWDKDGNHDFIGSMESNIASIARGTGQEIELKIVKGTKTKKSGRIIFQSVDPAASSPPAYAFRAKFSAKGLPRMDKMGLGKSDPFLEVYGKPPGQAKQCLINRTTYISNESNPVWEEIVLQAQTCGGIDAPITIRVTDHDNDGTHDFIGFVNTTLRELTFPDQKLPLQNRKKQGQLFYRNSGILTALLIPHTPDYSEQSIHSFRMLCHGKKLERKDMMGLGKSDPYFIIKREDNVEVYRSEIIKSKLNPQWDPFTLSVEACRGLDSPLVVEAWDWDRITKDDLIGKFTTSLRALSLYKADPNFVLINPSKEKNLTYRCSGFFVVLEMTPNFHQNQGAGRSGMVSHPSANPYASNLPPNSQSISQPALYPSASDPYQSQAIQPALYPTMNSGQATVVQAQAPLYPSTTDPYSSNLPNSNSPNMPQNSYNSNMPQNSYNSNMAQNQPPSYSNPPASSPQGNPPPYSTANQSNLPSYITGLPPVKAQDPPPRQPTTNDLYGSSSTYSQTNPPAYLSNIASSKPSNSNSNSNSNYNQSQNPGQSKPYGYL